MNFSPLKDSEYNQLRTTVYEFSRINLGPNKKELVTSRLSKRLRALNLNSFSEYCDYIQSRSGEDELVNLIDAISTNHTFFFREGGHFNYLRDEIIPAWLRKNRSKPLRIWSAACSSGEEAYSIAILMEEEKRKTPELTYSIECTDISTKILKKASDGIFAEERLREVPSFITQRYFQKGFGEWKGHYRIHPELRKKLGFRRLNLCGDALPWNEPFEVVFLRNVMIYFDRPTQEALVGKIHGFINMDGHLFVGHSESLTAINHPYKAVKPSIYQRFK